MTDLDLTPQEERDLRDLFRRAAEGVPTDVPDRRPAPRVDPGRRRLQAVAAVIVLVVAGLAVVLVRGGDQRLDTGPSDSTAPPTTGVVEGIGWRSEAGIWRLPDPDSDLRVTGVRLTTAPPQGFRFLVDDPDAPQRWIGVTNGALAADLPAVEGGSVTLADGTTLVRRDTTAVAPDLTVMEVTRADDDRTFTWVGRGVDRAELQAHVSSVLARIGPGAEADGGRVAEALAEVDPPAGLTVTWSTDDPDSIDPADPDGWPTAVELTVEDGSGRAISVYLAPTGVTAPVARLGTELLGRFSPVGDAGASPDLWADDGTQVAVAVLPGGQAGDPAADGTVDRVRDALRATTEQEFRDRVSALGVSLESDPPTTTTRP